MRQHCLWIAALLIGGASLPVLAAEPKTADEAIASYLKAVGGKEKLDAIKTMRITGKALVQGGMEMPMVLEMKRPNKVRVDSTMQGMTFTQAYDGKDGWMIMPFTGKTDPEKLPEDQVKQLASRADMDGALVDYKAKGHTVAFEGADEMEGTPVWKLKVNKKEGDVETYFLDKESFLPVGMKSKSQVQGTEMEVDVTFGDYKAVAGVMMPHSMAQKMSGMGSTTVFEKIEANIDIPDARFAMPEKKAEPASEKKEEKPAEKKP